MRRPPAGRRVMKRSDLALREEPAGDRAQRPGTLYVAETLAASVRERCGRFLAARAPIPETLIEGRVVSAIVGEASDLGDLTHPDVALEGVQTLAEVLVEMGVHPRAIPRQADVVDDEAEIDEL